MQQVLLIIFLLAFSPYVWAQFYIGSDFGAISYDISDEYIGTQRYENFTVGILNPGLFYINKHHLVFARFGKKVTLTDLAQDEGYQATNFLEIENYELDIEYFRKVLTISSKFEGFAGISHNGHFTYYKRTFRSPVFGNQTESHEMAALAFSVNVLVKYHISKNFIQYRAGFGVFNLGSRPGEQGNTIELRVFSLNDYFRIHHSLEGYIKISDRFLLKPEYKLRYYTFKDPNPFKMLKQSFFMGVYIRL